MRVYVCTCVKSAWASRRRAPRWACNRGACVSSYTSFLCAQCFWNAQRGRLHADGGAECHIARRDARASSPAGSGVLPVCESTWRGRGYEDGGRSELNVEVRIFSSRDFFSWFIVLVAVRGVDVGIKLPGCECICSFLFCVLASCVNTLRGCGPRNGGRRAGLQSGQLVLLFVLAPVLLLRVCRRGVGGCGPRDGGRRAELHVEVRLLAQIVHIGLGAVGAVASVARHGCARAFTRCLHRSCLLLGPLSDSLRNKYFFRAHYRREK